MPLASSKLTAQGQISVPAGVRRKLGLVPGSVLEWEEQDGQIFIRRAGQFTSEEIHKSLFPDGPPKARTLDEMQEGIRQHIRKRHARH